MELDVALPFPTAELSPERHRGSSHNTRTSAAVVSKLKVLSFKVRMKKSQNLYTVSAWGFKIGL